MSPTAIYRATDDRRHLESGAGARMTANAAQREVRAKRPERARQDGSAEDRRSTSDPGYRIDPDGLRLTDASERAGGVEFAPEMSPYRTAAQVLRIWIAPWEDEAGDLHTASRVYTEIEGRRWLVAEPHAPPRGTQVMQLVSSPAVVRPDPAPPTPAKPPPPAGHPTDSGTIAAGRK